MIKLTVEKAQQVLASKTSDELFELSMTLECQGQTELAEKVLDLACKKQATELYKSRKPEPAPAAKPPKPEPAAPSDDSQAYQAWLEAHAKPETEPTVDFNQLEALIDELDVPVELVKFSDFAHLSKQELVRMVKHLGLTVPPMPTRKELAQMLADAENGVQRPNLLAAEPKPKPEPTKPYQPAHAFEPADQYVPKQPEQVGYRELQALAKELGVKASGSYATIQARIERHFDGKAKPSDYPKDKKAAKPKAEPKPKAKSTKSTKADGLSYRQAQRFNSWCKANLAGVLPQGRNSGWNSVKLLMVGYIGSAHYKQVMANTKFQSELAAHLEVDTKDLFELINATATLG